MNNTWNLLVAGVGNLDAAKDALANFVSRLRTLGLTITNVQVIEGELHADFASPDMAEIGWSLIAYGEGDVSQAYTELPTFIGELNDAGINVMHQGITVGELRTDVVPSMT